MYLKHPDQFTLEINQTKHRLANPYDQLSRVNPQLYSGGKTDTFAWQLVNQPVQNLQGVLVYRGNIFVRRLFTV
jgi:hypothetical protein